MSAPPPSSEPAAAPTAQTHPVGWVALGAVLTAIAVSVAAVAFRWVGAG